MAKKSQLGEPGLKIGASAHFLSVGGKLGVVDVGGGFEGHGVAIKDIAPNLSFLDGKFVDFAIATHSHHDHLGHFPDLLERHPEMLAFMTDETFRLGCIAALDSFGIWRKAEWRARRRGEPIPPPPFSPKALEFFLSGKQIELLRNEWVPFDDGFNIGLYDAGHIKGASQWFIDAAGDRPFYGTGDISSIDQLTVPGVMLPPDEFLRGFFDEKGLVMITEATNGARDAKRSIQEERAALVSATQEVIARGGVVLNATYAVGKVAEISAVLLAAGIKPWVDGMSRETMKIEAPDVLARVNIVPKFEGGWLEAEAFRKELATTPGNVILASSGTLEGGTAVSYAKHVLPGRENAVFLIGHIFDETVAQKLDEIELGRTILLPDLKEENGVPVNVRCDVRRFDFTLHDYRSALIERACRVKPETLIVHHVGVTDGVDGFESLSAGIREAIGDRAPRIIRDEHMREINLPYEGGR